MILRFSFFAFLFLLIFWGCERPDDFKPYGQLGFSEDTVRFDTIFTTLPSPTERLLVYNRSGHPLEIAQIELEKGTNSEFQLIFDGKPGASHTHYQLNKGDSVYAFITMRVKTDQDQDIYDRLKFTFADGTEEIVTLYAHVLDAYHFRDTTIAECNATLPIDKPIVVDGIIYVQENCVLNIPAGAELYFSARTGFDNQGTLYLGSALIADGTLLVNGTQAAPVLFTNFRLNEDYQEAAGQWYGIILTKNSQANRINHAIIKNGSIGIRVDSVALGGEPKLLLENTEIRNMANFCLLGLGFSPGQLSSLPAILARNVVATNAGQNVIGLFGGGTNAFINCTFSSYANFNARSRSAVLGWTNYLRIENVIRSIYPASLLLQNCIVWGSREDEFIPDVIANGNPQLSIGYSLLRTKLENLENTNLLNIDPLFEDVSAFNFKLKKGSPAINAGLQNADTPFQDILGTARPLQGAVDIGAYEYTGD